jgi:putative spermidine/putrescine transport system substrate-binding protein
VYSPAGGNTWLKGFARPVLQAAMVKDGTVDTAALAALAPVTQAPVQLTQAQVKTASDYLKANWNITIK